MRPEHISTNRDRSKIQIFDIFACLIRSSNRCIILSSIPFHIQNTRDSFQLLTYSKTKLVIPRLALIMALTNFSDDDDRRLVQLVRPYAKNKKPTDWSAVYKEFRVKRALDVSKEQLRGRLKTLKQRWGLDLEKFPNRFLVIARPDRPLRGLPPRKPLEPPRKPLEPLQESHNQPLEHHEQLTSLESICAITRIDLENRDQPQNVEQRHDQLLEPPQEHHDVMLETVGLLDEEDLYDMIPSQLSQLFSQSMEKTEEAAVLQVVDAMFANIPKKVVFQAAGSRQHNVGELLPVGLIKLLPQLHINTTDIFLDVGCGIGNVVAQVALMTPVRSCIGVEMRRAVLECGADAVEKQKRDSPDLAKIKFIASRIENVSYSRLCDVTVFYCFDLTFECNATVYLHILACDLRNLRLVVVAKHPCPRHSQRCNNRFCRMWRLQQTVHVEVSYSKNLVPMHIFKRESLLSSLCL